MTDKIKVSVIIVTFNEENRIRRCLDSVKWAGEIVVVDQSSTDNTALVCREYTDKVYIVPNKGFCEPDRPVALSKASNEWILYLDADESVSDDLRREIETIVLTHANYDCYYMPRKSVYIGEWIRYSGWYPGYVLRFFKRDKVKFSEMIHTDVVPIDVCGYMRSDLMHYTYESIDEHVAKMARYTKVIADQSYAAGTRLTIRNFIFRLYILPSIYFLKKYIWQQGFRDGIRGLIICIFTFFTVFMSNAKLWEIQIRKNRI